MVFAAAFLGYSSGVAPVFGYHSGANDYGELKGLLKKSLIIIGTFSISMFVLSEGLAHPISAVFVGYDKQLMELTVNGFVIYSFAYLFMGMAIFSASFFTALNNGLVSAVISFLRILVFELGAVLLLPLIWEINGIWASIVVAEFMATVVGVIFMIGLKKKYRY